MIKILAIYIIIGILINDILQLIGIQYKYDKSEMLVLWPFFVIGCIIGLVYAASSIIKISIEMICKSIKKAIGTNTELKQFNKPDDSPHEEEE